MSDTRGRDEGRSLGWARLAAAAALVLASVFVFGFLPKLGAPPVVTTTPSASLPPGAATTAPALAAASASGEKTPAPDRAFAEADPPPRPAAPTPPPPAPAAAVSEPDAWTASVDEAQAALDRGAFREARDAFARAEAVRPGSAAVKDGLSRLEAAEKGGALDDLRRRGQEAEGREEWGAALNAYDAAQRIDPLVAFAVEGRARAVARQALDERLDGYLKRVDRLSTPSVAAEAEIALERAAETAPAGPRLQKQMAALRAAIASARTPVTVRLLSDGLTEVAILRVGRLGVFKEKALDLRPGAYVVVGTRRGYRDRRVPLEVAPGAPQEPVRVQCEEAL